MAQVRVRNLQTGQTGTISEQYLDPNKYQRLDGGSPVGGGIPQPQQGGGGITPQILQNLMGASQIAGKRPSVSNVLSAITSSKPSAAEEERTKENKFTAQLKKGADEIAQTWSSLNPLQKFIPFSKKFSADRAAAESMKRTHALQTINFLSGKQFSDRERQFILGLYPGVTDTDAVVRAKMNELKKFLDRYSGQTPSAELPSSFIPQ